MTDGVSEMRMIVYSYYPTRATGGVSENLEPVEPVQELLCCSTRIAMVILFNIEISEGVYSLGDQVMYITAPNSYHTL